MPTQITLPYNFIPRPYQVPTVNMIHDGFIRGVDIWHRRAGKDKSYLNLLIREAWKNVGTYFYMLPYFKQARMIVWEGVDAHGFRFIDHIPHQLIKRKESQQMIVELKAPPGYDNGSIIRLLGSDNIDSIVGTNPKGVVFSEFSLHKIAAWNYLRPILMENGGWAIFNGTPRGKNWLWKMWLYAQKDPRWFSQMLTVHDTLKPNPRDPHGPWIPVVSEADIELERQNGMPEELIQQEFFCSFEAGLVGAYYADLMNMIARAGHLTNVSWEPSVPVLTAWDLGFNDINTIWFFQVIGREVLLIDYYQNSNKPAGHYVNILNAKPYSYEEHFFPHDVEVHEYSTGNTRRDTFESLGLKNITTIPRMGPVGEGLKEGRNAVRQLLPKCWFDQRKCAEGIEALKSYRREWDEKNQTFRDAHVHDWASHPSDAFRILAWALGMRRDSSLPVQTTAMQEYNELLQAEAQNALYDPIQDYLNEDVMTQPWVFDQSTGLYQPDTMW